MRRGELYKLFESWLEPLVPKGLQDSPWGFNPRCRLIERRGLTRRIVLVLVLVVVVVLVLGFGHPICSPEFEDEDEDEAPCDACSRLSIAQ